MCRNIRGRSHFSRDCFRLFAFYYGKSEFRENATRFAQIPSKFCETKITRVQEIVVQDREGRFRRCSAVDYRTIS